MQVAMRSRNWSRTLTERSGGNGAVAVFMACYVLYSLCLEHQAASVTPWSMFDVMGSNDVTQQGSRPKTKVMPHPPLWSLDVKKLLVVYWST